jgi:hypothetical protein
MKIISLSSNIAGPACAIAYAIRKYYYNNNYKTNMFDFLEISFISIIQMLSINFSDIVYLSNNNEFVENDKHMTVKFKNFDKIYSHHDLNKNYTEYEYVLFIEKYKRRYIRLLDDIKIEKKIIFIRFGLENDTDVLTFKNIINKINPSLKIYYITLVYDDIFPDVKQNYSDLTINFYNYIKPTFNYSEDLFFKTLEFDWDTVFNKINIFLDEDEKKK